MSIVIVDYGAGNLRSVQKALNKLGFPAQITQDKVAIRSATGVILPGVGSFDAAIEELRSAGLEGVLEEAIALKKSFLGICLGLQMLFESSEEGKMPGLGILKGKVKKFNFRETSWEKLSIPHMGWNRIIYKRHAPIFEGVEEGSSMYFAHSYYVEPDDETVTATVTDYGINFTSSVWRDKLFGIQFHPEKSGETGLKILRNFAKLCSK